MGKTLGVRLREEMDVRKFLDVSVLDRIDSWPFTIQPQTPHEHGQGRQRDICGIGLRFWQSIL